MERIERRDFLKLAGAALLSPAAVRLDQALKGPGAEGVVGADFNLDLAPNKPFINFALDSMLVVNSANAYQGKDFENAVASGLAAKGYSSLANATDAAEALRLLGSGNALGWNRLLSSVSGQMCGAPVTVGKTVEYGLIFPSVSDLYSGDTLNAGQQVMILARANRIDNGEPVVLGSYINSKKGVKGGIVTEWMNQSRLTEVAGGLFVETRVVRSYEMDARIAENKKRISVFVGDYENQVNRGALRDVKPSNVSEVFAGMVAKRGSLAKAESSKNQWFTEGIKRLQYAKAADLDIWRKNRDVYEGVAIGLPEAMLISDIFPLPSYKDVYDRWVFYTDFCHKGLALADFLAHRGSAPIAENLAWSVPLTMNDFAFGDSVIISPREGLTKPEVGFVSVADIGPDSQSVNIIFFNWMGSGIPREISFKSFNEFKNLMGMGELGILRSKELDQMVQIREMRNRNILNSADIPEEIKHGRLGMHVDYRKIPKIAALQSRLMSASTFKERGEIMMKIACLMGVQTRDGAELHEHGYMWSEEDPREMCNLYSTSFFRALGLDADISHWTLPDGTPAFNTGEEMSAHDMNAWMTRFGPKYGWIPVTRMTKNERLELLRQGHVMYGATSGSVGDTLTIYGVEGKNGEVLPVLSKATWNNLSSYPYRHYHFVDPLDYWKIHPEAPAKSDILWAHAGPKIVSATNIYGK